MKALAVAVSATLIWCSTQAPAPAPAPPPDPGALTCATACENLRKLGCEEAAPTADGATCVEVCQNANNLPVACITRALSCPAAEDCP